MSEKNEPDAAPAESAPQWVDLWPSFSESSKQIAEAWSSSMAPFMLARLLEHPGGFAVGNEMSDAIEKMAQGPRLADVWDIDRKMALVFAAWMEMRQKLANYNAAAAAVDGSLEEIPRSDVGGNGQRKQFTSKLARSLCEVE
jgi:polyhydroxyalkanoate synthase subunit PhaE